VSGFVNGLNELNAVHFCPDLHQTIFLSAALITNGKPYKLEQMSFVPVNFHLSKKLFVLDL